MSRRSSKSTGSKAAKQASATRAPVSRGRKSTQKKEGRPKPTPTSVAGTLRLPKVGEKLTRTYRDREIVVEVLKDGFRYDGATYTSLTALARHITGYKAISGPAFFGLWKRAEAK